MFSDPPRLVSDAPPIEFAIGIVIGIDIAPGMT